MHHNHLSTPLNRGFLPVCDRPDPHNFPRHHCHFARSRPIPSLLEHHHLHLSFHVITLCSLLTACFRIFYPHLLTIYVPVLFNPPLKQSKSIYIFNLRYLLTFQKTNQHCSHHRAILTNGCSHHTNAHPHLYRHHQQVVLP
jgi:hypothetical protein